MTSLSKHFRATDVSATGLVFLGTGTMVVCLKRVRKTLTNFYRCTIESILSGCIAACFGNCTARNRRALQRVVQSVQHITGGSYLLSRTPTAPDVIGRPKKIIKDNHQPEPLPVHPAIIQKVRSVQVHQSWDPRD